MYYRKKESGFIVVFTVLILLFGGLFLVNKSGMGNVGGGLTGAVIGVGEVGFGVPGNVSGDVPLKVIGGDVNNNLNIIPQLFNSIVSNDNLNVEQNITQTQGEVSIQANCGGLTVCNCGDNITSSYNLSSDLTGCTGNGLTLASGVIFDCQGNTISGAASGADVGVSLNGNNITIRNCTIINFGDVVDGYGVTSFGYNNLIEYNHIYNSSRGIKLFFNGTISNNLIENLTGNTIYGIFISSSSTNYFLINNNVIRNLQRALATSIDGIYLYSGRGIVSNNTLIDVGYSESDNGIKCEYSTFTLTQNNISNIVGNGVQFLSSDNNLINNNTFDHISGYGLLLNLVDVNNTFIGNIISNINSSVPGVYISGSSNNFENNTIYNSLASGIYVISGNNNSFIGNNISNTGTYGIHITTSYNNVSGNILSNNSMGVYFQGLNSNYNSIIGNIFNSLRNDGYGINIYSQQYSIIKNNLILGYNTSGAIGILSSLSNYADISNNSIQGLTYGIFLSSSANNNLSEQTILNSTKAIYLTASDNNKFSSNHINNSNNGYYVYPGSDNNYWQNNRLYNNNYSIYFEYSVTPATNNTFVNDYINNSLIYDYYGSGNNIQLINLTFNKSKMNVLVNASVFVKWFVTVKVNNTEGDNLQGVNISAYNISGGLESSKITDVLGEVLFNLTEFVKSSSIVYLTNHTINATIGGLFLNYTSINLSQTGSTTVILSTNISTFNCGVINSDVTLLINLNINGSCFIVNSSNIVIDGNGAMITGNGTGIGLNSSNFNNITIKNLIFVNFSEGIYLENSSLSNITSNNINNCTTGIKLDSNSTNNFIFTNFIQDNVANGSLILNSNNNIIYNNYFSNNGNNAFDNSSNIWNITSSCGVTNIINENCTGGNFWADFNGSDSNFDNFGDTVYNISGGSNVDYLPLVNIPIISCGNVNQSITIPPGQVVTAGIGGDCFTILGDNLVINGNGATITSESLGNYGIYGFNVSNVTINNLTIKQFLYGVKLEGAGGTREIVNNTISNNFINTSYRGIILFYNDYSNISNNIIFVSSSYIHTDLYLQDSSHNYFDNNNLSTLLQLYYNSNNNTFLNGVVYGNISSSSGSSSGTVNNYLVNVSFNQSLLNLDANNYLHVKWFVDVNVSNSSGNAIENVTLLGYNVLGDLDNSVLTSSNGVGRLKLTEYYGENNVFYYITNNHTITAVKNGFTQNETVLNLINLSLNFSRANINLIINPIIFGMTLNTNAVLSENLSGSGNGLTIGADNLNIDGAGSNFISDGTGAGIILSGRSGLNISNINLINFSSGINLTHTNNSIFHNLNFSNNYIGIVFNNSNENKVYDSVFSNIGGTDIWAINVGGTNNSIINSTVNLSQIIVNGTANLYRKWYVRVNVTINGTVPLQGVNVTGFFTSNNRSDESKLTDSSGIAILELSELKINSSGISYLTPHNVTVSYISATETVVNSTIINISQTNNTNLNFSLQLNCTIPSNDLILTSNTTLCPGTYTLTDSGVVGILIAAAENITITCDNTNIVSATGFGKGVSNLYLGTYYNSISIIDCSFNNFEYDIYFKNSNYHNIINSSFNDSWNPAIYLDHTDNVTIQGNNFTSNSFGIYTYLANYLKVLNNTFISNINGGILFGYSSYGNVSGNIFDGGGLRFYTPSNNNTIYDNNFINNVRAVEIEAGTGNLFYHNIFASSILHVYSVVADNIFNSTFNVSGNMSVQGNQWDDFCNKGTDNNNDTYADGPTTNISNDYPYNSTISTKLFGSVVDYGPKIITCVTVVSLGSGGGGSSSSSTVESAQVSIQPVTPPPAVSGYKSNVNNPTEVISSVDYIKKNLKISENLETKRFDGTIQFVFSLENTGNTTMELNPSLNQDTDDPLFIVTRKTLGAKGSAFNTLAGLSYSENPIAGKLLKSVLVNAEKIVILPGEKVQKTLEIKEGFAVPKSLKIEFETFGETVLERDVQVQKRAISAAAVDVNDNLLDVYTLIIPEGVNRTNVNVQGGLVTGAAVGDLLLAQSDSPYFLELAMQKKGASNSTAFSDFYGPYKVKQGESFLFAQQLKVDKTKYNGDYVVDARVYHGNAQVMSKKFDVNFGLAVVKEDKAYLVWLIPLGVLVIIILQSFYLMYVVEKK